MDSTTALPPVRAFPQPPRLHWGFVLFFNMITVGIFGPVWLVVQAHWVRKVRGRSRAMPWAMAYAALPPLLIVGVVLGAVLDLAEPATANIFESLTKLFQLAIIFTRLVSIYTLRDELEESPIHISTSGVMTFFFDSTYFQYHLHDFVLREENRPPVGGTLGLSYR